MIEVTIAHQIHISGNCFLFSTENWSIHVIKITHIGEIITQFKTTEKMIGHHTPFQENELKIYLYGLVQP